MNKCVFLFIVFVIYLKIRKYQRPLAFSADQPFKIHSSTPHLSLLRQSWVEQQYPSRRPQYPPLDESILGPYFRAATAVMILPWEHNTCQQYRNKMSFHMQNLFVMLLPSPSLPTAIITKANLSTVHYFMCSWGFLICLVTWEYRHHTSTSAPAYLNPIKLSSICLRSLSSSASKIVFLPAAQLLFLLIPICCFSVVSPGSSPGILVIGGHTSSRSVEFWSWRIYFFIS